MYVYTYIYTYLSICIYIYIQYIGLDPVLVDNHDRLSGKGDGGSV